MERGKGEPLQSWLEGAHEGRASLEAPRGKGFDRQVMGTFSPKGSVLDVRARQALST